MAMDIEKLQKEIAVYEKIIDHAKNHRYGMPWMIPSWTMGLEICNEVLQEKLHDHENGIQS
jgi:hypothetical protein